MTLHDDELTITADTVRDLVAAQFPQWRGRPVRKVDAGGTVNAIFRIGDDLAARLPRRPLAPGPADPDATRSVLAREAHAAGLLAAAPARDLAALVTTLRAVDPGGRTFDGDNRGGDLRDHDGWMQNRLARLALTCGSRIPRPFAHVRTYADAGRVREPVGSSCRSAGSPARSRTRGDARGISRTGSRCPAAGAPRGTARPARPPGRAR